MSHVFIGSLDSTASKLQADVSPCMVDLRATGSIFLARSTLEIKKKKLKKNKLTKSAVQDMYLDRLKSETELEKTSR